MLGSILNDWRVLRRHPVIWIAIGAVALVSAAAIRGYPVDPEEGATAALLWINILFPMFLLPFLAGALAPIFYLREVDHDMAEIVGSYPMTSGAWLRVRVASFTLVMLFASLLSQLVSVALLLSDFPDEGGQLLADALKWLIVLQIPNCLLWASILAWVASRRANSGLIYFTTGMLWLAYNALATSTGSPMIGGSFVPFEPLRQAMFLIDPYAGTTLMSVPPEKGMLQSLEINVAAGRLFWLAVIVLLLRGIKTVPMLVERKAINTKRKELSTKPGWPSHVGIHLRYVARDKAFPLLILGLVALMPPEVIGGMDWVESLSRVEPDSRDALNRVTWDLIIGAGALILLYISDRVCRLYSGTRMHELYAATPHPAAKLVAVQLVSVWLIALFFVALAGLVVFCVQVAFHSPIQPTEYALQLGLAFSRLILFGGLYVAMHGLVRRRFLANLAGFLIVVFSFSPLLTLMKLYHPLLRPAGTTLSAPDHYWGFGGGVAGHWQFTAFWTAIGFGALLIAVATYHRTMPYVQKRLSAIVRHPTIAIAGITFGVAGLQGMSIDQTLRAEGALASPDERHRWRAAYERDYARWADVAQPEVEAIKARIDFFPSEQRARLRASLVLLNRTDEPISEVLVGRNQLAVEGAVVTIANAAVTRYDETVGQAIFVLDRPLAPGTRTTLEVDLTASRSNLSNPAFPLVMRPSFNSLPAYALLPIIGYRKEITLRDPTNRKDQGLPPIESTPPSQLAAGAPGALPRERVILHATITTETGYQAITQGQLLSQWEERGRSFFRYRTDHPIRALPAFFSVPWQPQRWSQDGIDVQVFSPETIAADNPNVLGMKDTLEYLGREIAPYPGSTFSLLAVPDIGFTGFALPQIIQESHKVAFRAHQPVEAGFSQRYRRAVHETAHQWFGHRLGYGVPEDRAFLIESLAKYAELVMIERRYGRRAMEALVDYERNRYREAIRNPASNVLPLIDADEGFDQYSRATIVFACLRQVAGDAPIIAALRNATETSEFSKTAATSSEVANAIMQKSELSARQDVRRLLLGTEPVESLLADLHCN